MTVDRIGGGICDYLYKQRPHAETLDFPLPLIEGASYLNRFPIHVAVEEIQPTINVLSPRITAFRDSILCANADITIQVALAIQWLNRDPVSKQAA
jgi:hypothetical protein